MNSMTESEVLPDIGTVHDELVWPFKHLWIVVARAKKDADPLPLLDRSPCDFCVLKALSEKPLNRSVPANTLLKKGPDE